MTYAVPCRRLEGKVAIITGGSSGIGKATAQLFINEGARVLIADIMPPREQFGAEFCKHDITSLESWKQLMHYCRTTIGTPNVLVNSAGIIGKPSIPHDPEYIDIEEWRRVIAINAEGTLLGCQAGIEAMKEQGGTIVNLAALGGMFAYPAAVDYGTSKAMVRHFTKSIAIDCAAKGYAIRCNSISPGAIKSPLWETLLGKGEQRADIEARIAERIPLGHWGEPLDCAYAILFLACSESKFITGVDIVIDGGQSAKGPAA